MHSDIRIGTLAPVAFGVDYLKQIIPLGFESFSLTFWQRMPEGIDLQRTAAETREALATTNRPGDQAPVISSLGMFGNPLEDEVCRQGWERCIDACQDFGCDIVAGFTGCLTDEPVEEALPRFKAVFAPLAQRAADRGVRLAFENCDMGGTWSAARFNLAHAPNAWEMLFNEVAADNVGLEWEPCHQMYSLVDPIPNLKKWVGKVFHVHGKDATVHWDVIREFGIRSGRKFVHHRTPGFGDTNWRDVISILRMAGFKGAIDIEGWHDPVYRDNLEMTGQVHALRYLQWCRGGEFVPNPVTPKK